MCILESIDHEINELVLFVGLLTLVIIISDPIKVDKLVLIPDWVNMMSEMFTLIKFIVDE